MGLGLSPLAANSAAITHADPILFSIHLAEAPTGTGTITVLDAKGNQVEVYTSKNSNFSILSTKNYPLLLQYTTSEGNPMHISLGKQTTLPISGEINYLTLKNSLPKGFGLQVGAKSKIGTLQIDCAALVDIDSSATVGKLLQNNKSAQITAPGLKNSSTQKQPVSTGMKIMPRDPNQNALEVTFEFKDGEEGVLFAEDGDTLYKLSSKLKKIINVYNDAGDTVPYSIKWKRSNVKFGAGEKSRTFEFTIVPRDLVHYIETDGSVMIIVESAEE